MKHHGASCFYERTMTGNTLHHISPGVRGPWLRPWIEIFGFRNFFFGFVVNPITVQNFSFLGYLEVPRNFSHVKPIGKHPEALGSAPGQKFWVFAIFPLVSWQNQSPCEISTS